MSRRAPALALALSSALLIALAGCGHRDHSSRKAHHPPPDGPEAEADLLGRQLFELVDRAMDYKSSHRNQPPTALWQLGLDSLTPATVSRMTVDSGTPTITVAYRAAGHTLQWCRAGSGVLEEASLNDGRFTVLCGGAAGQASYQVNPAAR